MSTRQKRFFNLLNIVKNIFLILIIFLSISCNNSGLNVSKSVIPSDQAPLTNPTKPSELIELLNPDNPPDPDSLPDTTSPIKISVSTSRINGIAPLTVFFDATETTGLTDNNFFANHAAYMDATFAWNFDADNQNQNEKHKYASGFVAAHVFEKPGTYRVHLNVFDAAGVTNSHDITITVAEFSGTTYYVSSDGSDDISDPERGLSMSKPFLTPEFALTGPHVQPNTRILLRNGDIYTISDMIIVQNKVGPVIIGAYNDPHKTSIERPLIYITAVNKWYSTIHFMNCSDFRIMDIATRGIDEGSAEPKRYPCGISWDSSCTYILKYRTREYYNGGISLSPNGQFATIAECIFHNTTNTGFTSNLENPPNLNVNDSNAIIGNWVYDKNVTTTEDLEHVFRLQGGSRYFIAHNTLGPNVRVEYDALTIRGDSEKVVIYKNWIEGWSQDFTTQNRDYLDEQQHHCIMDSNLIIGPGLFENDRQTAILLRAKDIVIRNNIIYNYYFGIIIHDDSVCRPSQRIKIYNNNFINPSLNDFTAISIA